MGEFTTPAPKARTSASPRQRGRIDQTANGPYIDSNGRTDLYLTDQQFSPVAVIDLSAKLVERVTYSAYGQPRHRWPGDLDGDGDADTNDQNLITFGSGGSTSGRRSCTPQT